MNASAQPHGEQNPSTIQVFIPVHNDIRYLPSALASVLGQEGVDVEVIVSDNASTDGTYEYALRAAADDPRVKVHRNPTNLGSIPNVNLFAKYVTADYYIFLCSDDALGDPMALRKARDILDREPDVVSVYADMLYIDGNDRKLATRRFRPTGAFDACAALRRSVLLSRNCFGIPLLNRRSAYADLRYPERMTYVSDVFVAARAAERGRVFHIAEPLIWNRYTGCNLTSTLALQSTRQFSDLIEALGLRLSTWDRLIRASWGAILIPSKYVFLQIARLRS
jgi:glycosyltransferase involved in cell wall biosynthesis